MVSTKMNIIWLIFILFLQIEINFAKKNDEEKRVNAKKFVEEVNSKNGGKWKAAYNERFALMEEEQKKKLAGAIINSPRQQLNLSILENNGGKRQSWDARRCSTNIQFDAREEWPQCAPIINTIQDQADCASCWAVATASVYSDRHCIEHAKAGLPIQNSATFHFSSLDLIGCEQNSNGCGGGYPNEAWKWIRQNGICTGTGFKWGAGCKPYPFRPTHRENSKPSYWSPQCQSSCTNDEYGRSYYADKNYPTWIGWLEGNAVSIGNIKEEIRANGSVAAIMDLYNDIYYYNSGVYAHSNNARYEIGHVVRLIGWGTQTCSDGFNTDFWLAMNSWNTDWGEDGVFKIERGTNECGIEQYGLFYGTPEVRTGNENKDGNGQ